MVLISSARRRFEVEAVRRTCGRAEVEGALTGPLRCCSSSDVLGDAGGEDVEAVVTATDDRDLK